MIGGGHDSGIKKSNTINRRMFIFAAAKAVLFFSVEINYYEILGNILFTFLLYYIFAYIFDIYRKIISRIQTW